MAERRHGVVPMAGVAPDGSPLLVSVDLDQGDDAGCPATLGTGMKAWCTLLRDHPGPWHVATTDTAIVVAWPVEQSQEENRDSAAG